MASRSDIDDSDKQKGRYSLTGLIPSAEHFRSGQIDSVKSFLVLNGLRLAVQKKSLRWEPIIMTVGQFIHNKTSDKRLNLSRANSNLKNN